MEKDQEPEKSKVNQRRLVPNIPAFERFLKMDLGGNFAKGLKEGDKRVVEDVTPPESLDERFQAMLLTDTSAREAKRKATR